MGSEFGIMKKYELKGENLSAYIEMTEEDGTIRFVPISESNSDYQAYLNKDKVEQSTPIPTE